MSYQKTILHVDDDPLTTRLVEWHLRPLGYKVTSLNDPEHALRMLSEAQHRLVLLDIDMPQFNGIDLLREIKSQHGGIQVIMLTGLVSMQTLLQSYRWGAEFCIFKPLTDVAPLVQAIETVFRKIDHWWLALEELGRQKRALDRASDDDLPPVTTDFLPGQLAMTPALPA